MYIPSSTHTAQPSAQALDLGQRITTTVRAYLSDNPGVRPTDVAQAFMVARQMLRSDLGGIGNRAIALVVAGLIGVLCFGVAAALYLGGGFDARFPMIVFVIALLSIIAVVAAMMTGRGA
jgi:hypothetical protein